MRKPHPICGHMKPLFSHKESGPCDWCLGDLEREYLNLDRHQRTWDDIRGERRVLLEMTDWVDINSARVTREKKDYVKALQDYRTALFNITSDYKTPAQVKWPVLPLRESFQ